MKRYKALRVPEYLQHIVDAVDRATGYLSGMDYQGFERDSRTQDAVIRSIEVIGEAAQRVRLVDPEFAARHNQVPWEQIYGMRNRIVHDYFEIDLEVVWKTAQMDLPILRQQIAALITSP